MFHRRLFQPILLCLLIAAGAAEAAGIYANDADKALAGTFAAREKDWRNGAIVYQVLVDRFAPSSRLAEKKSLYPAPKILRDWSETPKRGAYVEGIKLWSHEIEIGRASCRERVYGRV